MLSAGQMAGLLALATILVRWPLAWWLGGDNNDLLMYLAYAVALSRGDTLYPPLEGFPLFPYPPYSQATPLIAWELSNLTGWRFNLLMRLPCILADAAATWMISRYLTWRGASVARAAAWTAVYVFNPVGIIASALHGNTMALVPTVVFAAFVLAEHAHQSPDRRRLAVASALTLGIALAIRPYAAPLLPIFVLLGSQSLAGAVVYGLVALLPVTLSMLPYLVLARQTLLVAVLSYSGFPDLGWAAALRTIPSFFGGARAASFDATAIEGSKRLFIVGNVALLPMIALFDRAQLRHALLIAPLLFYGLYAGVSAQYLVWILPFAVAFRQWLVLPYTVLATVATCTFFILVHPAMMFGPYPPLVTESPTVVALFGISNGGLAALSLLWAGLLVGSGLRRPAWDGLVPTLAGRVGLKRRACGILLTTVSAAAGLVWLTDLLAVITRVSAIVQGYLR